MELNFNCKHPHKEAGPTETKQRKRPIVLLIFYRTNSTIGRPGDRGSIPGRGERIFPLTSVSRPALKPTQPPVQWVTVVLSPGRDADHLPPSSVEVENE
jgi:hypothetical protein